MIIIDFDAEHFLQEYWQKKPCLIKQFVPNFVDPIDENDLAGLAQEEGVDSRIVSMTHGKWDAHQGPFENFEEYCKGDWSLLVQGVNNYIDEVDALSDLVDFIPNWRFDDVMVSYSSESAGVGAHTDQYDVFIVQGKGSRRWQVGLPNSSGEGEKEFIPHPLLKLIEEFTPVIDEVLLPGDAIYIPPKHPHRGKTLTPCLNYSLGFRAPTNLELLTGLLDESDSLEQAQTRYTDSDLSVLREHSQSSMQVTNKELAKLKETLVTLLNTPQANGSIMQYLSRQGLPCEQFSHNYTVAEIEELFTQDTIFERQPGIKPIYSEQQGKVFTFYIDGNKFEVDKDIELQTKLLLESSYISEIPTAIMAKQINKSNWLNLMMQLLSAGYWLEIENE